MSFFRFKILLSLIFAYILSWYLSSNVFLAGTPVVRPDAGQNILQIPLIAQSAVVRTLAHFSPIKSPPPINQPTGSPIRSQPSSVPPNNNPSNPPIARSASPTSIPTPTRGFIYISPTPTLTPVPGVPTQVPQPTAVPVVVTKDQFAQCLTSKGLKFYMNAACPACRQTKTDFGASYKYLTEISCDRQAQLCRSKPGVGIGPAWELADGKLILAAMNFYALQYHSGCQQPTL